MEETACVFVEVKGLPADESNNTSSKDVFKTQDVAQWYDSNEVEVKMEPPEEVTCENFVDALQIDLKLEQSVIKEENIDEDDSFDYTTYGSHFNEDMKNEQQQVGSEISSPSEAPNLMVNSDRSEQGSDASDVCNKRFTKSSNLREHKSMKNKFTHTKDKTYQCDVCNKRFYVSSKLIRHKRVHTGEKPYVCDVCNRGFTQLSNLAQHKLIHTGEKPHACNICNRIFTQRSTLATHQRVHTGEKPYACDVCNKRFTFSSSLTEHKRIHTGNKPYVCDICNNRYTASSALTKHKRTHIYKCQVCNKGFRHPSKLATHKLIHTDKLNLLINTCFHAGEKPYACNFCTRRFIQRSTLIAHERLHTGEKPYVCDVCIKRFTFSSDLTSHKRTHTENECNICNQQFISSLELSKHKHSHWKDQLRNALKVCKKEPAVEKDNIVDTIIDKDDIS